MNEWHRYLPMVLLAVSLLFLAGGVFSILAAEFEWPYCMAERPFLPRSPEENALTAPAESDTDTVATVDSRR